MRLGDNLPISSWFSEECEPWEELSPRLRCVGSMNTGGEGMYVCKKGDVEEDRAGTGIKGSVCEWLGWTTCPVVGGNVKGEMERSWAVENGSSASTGVNVEGW